MTENSITWNWNAVEGAIGYAVQVSTDEMFDATDTITPTVETSFTASDLPPSTTLYGRVAAAAGSLEAPLLSDWTTHVTGMTPAPGAPPPLPAPADLRMSAATDTSITWSWDAVMEADGYHIQFNTEQDFSGVDPVATTETSHTQTDLSEGMTGYLRVRSTAGDRYSMWTANVTAMTRVSPVTPSNLTATAGEGSITWTWDPVDGADSYHVQYSADGAFTDGGDSMEVMETSYTKKDLGTGDTAYLRVRASGGTGDQARLMSDWSDPLRGMSATLVVPPPPANLTATGGDGSITWTWDMVEGATGYQVQVSMTEDFSSSETVDVDETSHTEEVAAGTTAYLRVRATGMGDPSDWTLHRTGTSNAAAPPPPPTVAPVWVEFTLSKDAKSQNYLIAHETENDRKKAMARVNTQIMVESNATAAITPEFVEDAAAVTVAAEAGNMPFVYVDWNLLQEKVLLGEGAVFKIQRTAMGANQMMEPTGDVVYVTCGPFECSEPAAEKPARPEIAIADSATCTDWEASVDLDMGLVDNDVVDTATDGDDTANDGIDLAWLATSNQPMVVEHKFYGIAGGTNGSFKSEMKKKGDDVALKMSRFPTTGNAGIQVDTATPAFVACVPDSDGTASPAQGNRTYDMATRDGIYRPAKECFRLVGKGANKKATATTKGPDWLSGYTLEMSVAGAVVSWGQVDWGDDDPFGETCPVKTVDVADEKLDVCELFKAEVAQATKGDWSFKVNWNTEARTVATGNTGNQHRIERWDLTVADATPERFSTLWFDDDLDRKIKNENEDRTAAFGATTGQMHDLYENNRATSGGDADDATNLQLVWQLMTNTDNTPNRDDFGKVDLVSDEDDKATADDERTIALETCTGTGATWTPADYDADDLSAACSGTYNTTAADLGTKANPDGNADNYNADGDGRGFRSARKCTEADTGDDVDNSICDAKWDETFTILFADGTFGCTDEVDVVVECTWDAQGEMNRGRGASQIDLDASVDDGGDPTDDNNTGNFYKCTAK